VAGLRAGDPGAFDAVYETYRARIYSFLLRLTRNTTLARDLAQEVWLRLSSRAALLQPDTELGAWLFTVARNLFVSHRRWVLLDRERLAELGLLQSRPQPATPLEEAIGSAVHAHLERAIAALPMPHREMILLISVEGFSIDEVATMLDMKEDAVRKRLSRARAAIQETMDQHFPDHESKR
jgi:RNA polymerase sigma-70 factor (ECF subfamily)